MTESRYITAVRKAASALVQRSIARGLIYNFEA